MSVTIFIYNLAIIFIITVSGLCTRFRKGIAAHSPAAYRYEVHPPGADPPSLVPGQTVRTALPRRFSSPGRLTTNSPNATVRFPNPSTRLS